MTPDFVMVRLPRHLADAIDAVKGDVPRERWVRRRLEETLAGGEPSGQAVSSTPGRSSGSKPVGPGATPGVPAKAGPPSLGETWRR